MKNFQKFQKIIKFYLTRLLQQYIGVVFSPAFVALSFPSQIPGRTILKLLKLACHQCSNGFERGIENTHANIQ
jgi:hypothetical protein